MAIAGTLLLSPDAVPIQPSCRYDCAADIFGTQQNATHAIALGHGSQALFLMNHLSQYVCFRCSLGLYTL